MNLVNLKKLLAAALLASGALGLFGCEPPDPMDPQVDPAVGSGGGPAESQPGAAQAKPSAPISVEYNVVGTPVAGQATEVELTFASSESEAPVYASYEIVDSSALSFVELPAERVRIDMQRADSGSVGHDRLRVTPHREGRYYLTVLTEIETDIGRLTKSTSLPIDVAGLGAQLQSKQSQQAPETEVQVDSSGEAIISMPAKEGSE